MGRERQHQGNGGHTAGGSTEAGAAISGEGNAWEGRWRLWSRLHGQEAGQAVGEAGASRGCVWPHLRAGLVYLLPLLQQQAQLLLGGREGAAPPLAPLQQACGVGTGGLGWVGGVGRMEIARRRWQSRLGASWRREGRQAAEGRRLR